MKIVRCEVGNHFYDSELHEACPQCGKEQDMDVSFGEFPNPGPVITPIATPAARATVFCAGCGKAMSISKEFCTNCGRKLKKPVIEPVIDAAFPKTQPVVAQSYSDEAVTATVAAAVAEAVSESVGRVDTPPQTVAASAPYGVTESIERTAISDDQSLVVGWLVCASGAYRGRSFEIKDGQNYIGRALDMDIVLEREASVSFLRHAAVIYEPAKGIFYVQQGESRGLTYLGDELVLTHVELHAYDTIRLGSAEFVFVPLCGDRFSWDEHVKK